MGEDGGLGGILLGKSRLRKGSTTSRGSIVTGRRGSNSDLHSNLATIDLLASKCLESLLLLRLITNIDETVALAATRLAETAADNASRNDVDTSFLEELTESGIVDIESEVGDENNRLGGLAFGLFALNTRNSGGTRLPGLLGSSFAGRGLSRSGGGLISRFSFGSSLLGFGLALRNESRNMNEHERSRKSL